MQKPITAAVLLALALAACSNESNPPAAASAASAASAVANVCEQPNLAADIRTQLQKAMADAAAAAGERSRGMVDVAKLSAAAARLEVQTDTPAEKDGLCLTHATITIPTDMLEDAAKYAPLLNGKSPEEVFSGSNLVLKDNLLQLPLRFKKGSDGKAAVETADLQQPVQGLTDALTAFAVKDTVMQGGKPVGRDEALRRLSNPLPEPVASAPAAVAQTVPTLDDTVPNPPLPGELAQSNPPEVLQPETPQARISAQELESARQANEAAGSSIRSAWKAIDPEIQKSLIDEQKNWESKKQQSCRNAGAKGSDKAEAQYLQIQCDTRLTRERVQYLNGYSIQ